MKRTYPHVIAGHQPGDDGVGSGWFVSNSRPRSRGGIRPSFACNLAPLRSEGAGKAGCQPHPMALCAGQSVKRHTSIAVTTGSTDIRLSLHDGLTAYSALSSGQLFPVIASNALRLVPRLGDFAFVQLEHQPGVPGPHGFAVRLLLRPSCAPVNDHDTDIDGVRPMIIA